MEQKCPNCNGGGVIQEYDEFDRYHAFECYKCGGSGVINDNELKPCPFCGGKSFSDETKFKYGTTYSVYCEECGAEITRFEPSVARTAWNRRAE